MTSDELADGVEEIVRATRARVLGVGDQQYSQGSKQKFETMTLSELHEWYLEEIQDGLVYLAMLHIRMSNPALLSLLKELDCA